MGQDQLIEFSRMINDLQGNFILEEFNSWYSLFLILYTYIMLCNKEEQENIDLEMKNLLQFIYALLNKFERDIDLTLPNHIINNDDQNINLYQQSDNDLEGQIQFLSEFMASPLAKKIFRRV